MKTEDNNLPDKQVHLDEAQKPYAWIVMGNLWAIDIANVLVFMSIGVLIPIWREEIGLTPMQAGVMGSVGFLGFGMMALPASIWLTKYNPKVVTLITTLGMAIAALMHSFSYTVEMLILSRFSFIVLASGRLAMQIIFIQQWFQPRLYSIANGLDFSIRSVGQALALIIVPTIVVLSGSWRPVYIWIAIYMGMCSLLWVFLGKQNSEVQSRRDPNAPQENPGKVLFRKKVLWIIASSQIGVACTFASFITFYPSYSMEHLNISVSKAGLLMSAFPLGGMLGSIFGGVVSQKIGRRKPIIWISGIILPLLYITLLNLSDMYSSMVALLFIGAVAMSFPPILFTIPLDMKLSPREVAVAGGLNRTLFPLGATMGPFIVGSIQESSGSLFLGLMLVSPLPITLALASLFIPETGPKGPQANRM